MREHDRRGIIRVALRQAIVAPAKIGYGSGLFGVPREFVLYGGTALALHLGHRTSVDFDFFGARAFEPARLASTLPFLAGATITQQEPNTLSVSVDRGGPVKISFFGLPTLGRLSAPLVAPDNGVQVASLLDLAGTKAAVVQQRAEAKDYLDIDALLNDRRIDLPAARLCARDLWPDVQPSAHAESPVVFR